MADWVEIGIALGANLGDRRANLRFGLAWLPPRVRVTKLSPLYESAPVGVTDQPAFQNAVCLAETGLEPLPLLDYLKEIEHAAGRRPGRRWGPRPLDLDILFFGDRVIELERLTVPHPRMRERGFVLRPLADLDPERRLPGWTEDVQTALAAIDTSDLVAVAGPEWGAEAGED